MELFLDTANISEIAEINAWGVLDGVTTNPTLAAREGKDFASMIKEICAEVAGPVSAEVVSNDKDEMVAQGRELAAIADNVVVKLPLTPAGLGACKVLTSEGIKTNVTLCFSSTQAILAARAGATYISPFLGRVDDIANDGVALLEEICDIYKVQGYSTKVLAASLRGPQHVALAARAGADCATLPTKVFKQMVAHPLTDKGLAAFDADWAAYLEAMNK